MPRFMLIAALLALAPASRAAETIPSFLNDVMPILTRAGCNQGSCHGKGAGQNGFRLSLRGYAPEADYLSITREFNGRRIENGQPELSQFLRKPIADAPHEGGKLFDRFSREYAVLLKWIEAGAPGPDSKDPKITKLEVAPLTKTLKKGEVVPLIATATFSDGTKRDVTWLTTFNTGDAAIIGVDDSARITARRSGETAVRAAFLTEVAVGVFAVPYEQKVDASRLAGKNTPIDEPVFRKLQALNIEPSDACTDAEFIRRVYLDVMGALPSPDAVRAFLADASADKRAKLIDAALESPEFVDYRTQILADLLQNRRERDHDVRGIRGVRAFHQWLRNEVAANRPWNELARSVLTSTGSVEANPAIGYYIVNVGENREADRSEVVSAVAQSFLGTRIGCAQCHNHPLEKYTQDDFYHFAAFFSRIKMERKEPADGQTMLKVSHADANRNGERVGIHQPRTGQFIKPQPLDRSTTPVAPFEDPRRRLTDWIVSPKNEAFSGSMVNRTWKHFFGTGLVEPVDDIRATNPPSNPELWKLLNTGFVESGYDMKKLIRGILNSRTYQLSSSTRPTNETDTRFYSHYYARRLPAEVLLDAISTVTGMPDTFSGYPQGVKAVQVSDPGVRSYFLGLFGKSERVTACACERSGDVTMPQLLHLQNGESLISRIRSADSKLSKILATQKDDTKATEELFLLTLARLPSEKELSTVKGMLASGDPRDDVYRDLFWALLNSKVFAFNH